MGHIILLFSLDLRSRCTKLVYLDAFFPRRNENIFTEKVCNRKHRTQFEIEHRSCGQSMTNLRLFSCGGQHNFKGCNFVVVDVPCKKLTKKWEKKSKINPVVTLHYVLH